MSLTLTSVTARTPWQSVLHLKIGADCQRIFCFIGGFSQAMSAWRYFQDDVIKGSSDGIVLIGRRHEVEPGYVGLTSLADQIDEVDAAITWIITHYLKGAPLVLIGHSVGGLIAREVTARHLDKVHSLIQIAPVPIQRFALLGNSKFWTNGGILATLTAPMGILNSRGYIPPTASVRGLFTGKVPENDFWQYIGELVPDSVRVFIELMVFYDGTKTWNIIKENLRGQNIIVVAPADKTIPRARLETMAKRQGDIRYLAAGTPHCIQFAPELDRRHNTDILRDVFGMCMASGRSTLRGRG